MAAVEDTRLEMVRELALQFASGELEGLVEERDRFPFSPPCEDLFEKARQAGFFTLTLPEEWGGEGEGMQALAVLLEGLCRTDASLGAAVFVNALAQSVLSAAGTIDSLRDQQASARTYGEALLAFPAYADPQHRNPGLAAFEESGAYSISGRIEQVVLGGIARRAVLPAVLEDTGGCEFFVVDTDDAGVRVGEPVMSLGLRACPAADLEIKGASAVLIGGKGTGESSYRAAVDLMSAAAAAMAAGVMRGSFDEALSYAGRRLQGGRRIADWSQVRMILAGMAVKVETSQLLWRGACEAAEEEKPGWRAGSRSAALLVQEMACDVTTDGIQVLGGCGYMKDHGQEKRYRDAKQIQSLLGTSPIRKLAVIEAIMEGER